MLSPGTYGCMTVKDTNGCLGLFDSLGRCVSVDNAVTREGYAKVLEGPGGSYLMTGGGMGIVLDMLGSQIANGLQVTVLEIVPELAEALGRQYPAVHVAIGDARTYGIHIGKRFDMVILDHVGYLDGEGMNDLKKQKDRYSACAGQVVLWGDLCQ